jgi:hypothetical protein
LETIGEEEAGLFHRGGNGDAPTLEEGPVGRAPSRAAKVSSIGLAAGFLGVDQIVFDVPDGVGSGNVEVNLQAGSTVCGPPPIPGCHFTPLNTSNTVKLAVL